MRVSISGHREETRVRFAVISFACFAIPAWLAVTAAPSAPANRVQFTDVTAQAGIKFVHNAGKSGKKYLPETLGSGAAFFDADGDGWIDILLVNGKDWTPRGRRTTAALYHNNHNGTFTDVTRGSGFDVEMYGIGVAVADFDNDGREDVYVTALEGDRLFHNEGNGKFRDVTEASGIRNANFGTSAAWLDYDRDGKLDLFVANYVQWTQKDDLWCSLDGNVKSYCTPESYKGTSSRLFHNLGGGHFEDVTNKAGVGDPNSKSLGVTIIDFDNDGWPDIFVSNDTQPNKLYRNNRNGTFGEQGMSAGVAYGEDGVARSTVVQIHIGQKEESNEAEWEKVRAAVNAIDRDEIEPRIANSVTPAASASTGAATARVISRRRAVRDFGSSDIEALSSPFWRTEGCGIASCLSAHLCPAAWSSAESTSARAA